MRQHRLLFIGVELLVYILANLLFVTGAMVVGLPDPNLRPDNAAGAGFLLMGVIVGSFGALVGVPSVLIYFSLGAYFYRKILPTHFDLSDNASAVFSTQGGLSVALAFALLVGVWLAQYAF